MSRLQAGALTLHRRPVGVEEIVPAALSSLGDRARGFGRIGVARMQWIAECLLTERQRAEDPQEGAQPGALTAGLTGPSPAAGTGQAK